ASLQLVLLDLRFAGLEGVGHGMNACQVEAQLDALGVFLGQFLKVRHEPRDRNLLQIGPAKASVNRIRQVAGDQNDQNRHAFHETFPWSDVVSWEYSTAMSNAECRMLNECQSPAKAQSPAILGHLSLVIHSTFFI